MDAGATARVRQEPTPASAAADRRASCMVRVLISRGRVERGSSSNAAAAAGTGLREAAKHRRVRVLHASCLLQRENNGGRPIPDTAISRRRLLRGCSWSASLGRGSTRHKWHTESCSLMIGNECRCLDWKSCGRRTTSDHSGLTASNRRRTVARALPQAPVICADGQMSVQRQQLRTINVLPLLLNG